MLYFIILGIIIILFTSFLILKTRELCKKDEEKIFLIISILMGSLYVFAGPIFTGTDEHIHYYRIYEIAKGSLKTPIIKKVTGEELPESLVKSFTDNYTNMDNINQHIKYKNLFNTIDLPLEKNKKIQYGKSDATNYVSASIYSPVQYLPQAIGFKVAIIFNLSPTIIGYIGRIANLFFYIFMGVICLKILPFAKMFILCILLSPIMLGSAATLSPDIMTITSILLFISIILSLKYTTAKLTQSKKICLFICAIVLSLCKIVYIPILFLLLLIPHEKFSSKKERKIFIILTIFLGLIANLYWLKISNIYFNNYYTKTDDQIKFVLSHPIHYISIFFYTYCQDAIPWLKEALAGYSYQGQVSTYTIFGYLYLMITILSTQNEKKEIKRDNFSKVISGIIILVIIALISTALYVQCTANFYGVGYNQIAGIQGRYFIPILLLIPFIYGKNKTIINNMSILNIIIFVNTQYIIMMVNQFLI